MLTLPAEENFGSGIAKSACELLRIHSRLLSVAKVLLIRDQPF